MMGMFFRSGVSVHHTSVEVNGIEYLWKTRPYINECCNCTSNFCGNRPGDHETKDYDFTIGSSLYIKGEAELWRVVLPPIQISSTTTTKGLWKITSKVNCFLDKYFPLTRLPQGKSYSLNRITFLMANLQLQLVVMSKQAQREVWVRP